MLGAAFTPFDKLFIEYMKNNGKHDMAVQHYHDSYEIYLQISGIRYLFNNNVCYNLNKGDLVIFKPFDIHYTESRDSDFYERYVLNFNPHELSFMLNETELKVLLDALPSCVIHLNDNQTKQIYEYFKTIETFKNRGGFLSDKLMYSSLFQFITELSSLTKTADITTARNVPEEIVSSLLYINERYSENIDLEFMANMLHISKYYFCRLFHRTTGATFLHYLYNIRLTKVHTMLLETDMNLNEIATRTGFTSGNHLSHVFRKTYNMSPREFKKLNHKKN